MKKDQSADESIRHCQAFYEAYFERQVLPFEESLEATLHIFLNRAPASSILSSRHLGIVECEFWQQSKIWPNTPVTRFALSQILRSELPLCSKFFISLLTQSPSLLRPVIRHSQLFRKSDSKLYQALKLQLHGTVWANFFQCCDELTEKEHRYKQQLNVAEKRLSFLTPFAFTFYASVVCWELYFKSFLEGEVRDFSDLLDLALGNKFKQSRVTDFELNENSIHESVTYHFAPLLIPKNTNRQKHLQSFKNLSAMYQLIACAQHLLNQQSKIESFCVATEDLTVDLTDSKTDETCNFSETRWKKTAQKAQLLWNYWMQRGVTSLLDSSIEMMISEPEEQQDAVWTGLAKTQRTMLQIETLFGVCEDSKLTDNNELSLIELVRFVDLLSGHFTDQYIMPLTDSVLNGENTAQALAKLLINGLVRYENRFPITWSSMADKSTRMADWFKTPQYPQGNELTAQAALEYWSFDARKFVTQSLDKTLHLARLHEKPIIRFGDYLVQLPFFSSDTDNFNALVNNLRRLNRHRPELKKETHFAENNLASALREKGFSVLVGYKMAKDSEGDVGEIDLICALDGVVILIEMKTSYVRSKRIEIWLHRNNTLRKAGWQLKRKQKALLRELQTNAQLRQDLDLADAPASIYAWIVDTSIEYDGHYLDDFLVVSREVLEIVIRDELSLLRPVGDVELEVKPSFFKDGFSPSRFVEVIEKQLLWTDLEERHTNLTKFRNN